MHSISLPGLVLWLPLGSPAACLQNTQQLPTISLFPCQCVIPHSLHSNAWPMDFPECTTLRSHCRHCRLKKVHLKAPAPFFSPFTALRQQTPPPNTPPRPLRCSCHQFPGGESGGEGTGNPSPPPGGFIASFNPWSFFPTLPRSISFLHRSSLQPLPGPAAPSYCSTLDGDVTPTPPGVSSPTEFHTHPVASVLVYLVVVVQYCVVVQSFLTCPCSLSDKYS